MTIVVLEAAVRSAVLIILVGTALALVRLRNPHRLKAVWTCVVLASLGMPLLTQIHIAPALAAPILQRTLHPGAGVPAHASTLRALGVFVYVVPALLLLWRHTFAWRRLWRIRRDGLSLTGPWADGLDVRVSADIPSPSTFGTTILLPQEYSIWSRPKLAAVIAHERAHVLHRDCYVLWLARLHACVLWFNPLAWWLVRRLAALAEQTSDEAAVEALGDRANYAEILLGLRMSLASEVSTAMASSDLPARIERILSGVASSPSLKRPQLLLMVAAVLPAVALAAAPLRLTQAPSAGTAQASAAVGGPTSEPKVVSWGPLASYYPREALRKGMEGMVELAITLDSAGRATDTRILSEDPLDQGFGAAASAAAHAMQYSNPTGLPVTFNLMIQFAPSQAPPPGHADSSSSESGG